MSDKKVIYFLSTGIIYWLCAGVVLSLYFTPNTMQVVLVFYFLALLYTLPAFISAVRDSPNFILILVINIFLGWTGLIWLALFIWAALDRKSEPKVIIVQAPPQPVAQAPQQTSYQNPPPLPPQ